MTLINKISNLSRIKKQIILFFFDCANLYFCLYLAYIFRYNNFDFLSYFLINNNYLLLLFPFVTIPFFIRNGLYRAVLKHFGIKTFLIVFQVITVSTVLIIAILYINESYIKDGLLAINWFISIVATLSIRYIGYLIIYQLSSNITKKDSVLIYGAGDAGIKLSESINRSDKYSLIAFLDDDKSKTKTIINSLKVYHSDEIEHIIQKFNIDIILLAIPSLSLGSRKQIIENVSKFPIKVKELPSIENIIDGKVEVSLIKNVDVETIIGRDIVKPIDSLIKENIKNKNILITGGGGSIGSELCRQVIIQKPKKLVILDHSEFNLYSIHHELKGLEIQTIPVLCNINNRYALEEVFNKYFIDTVYHAAAYKHVPMVEYNPCEGVYNNIIGTNTLVEIAYKQKVKSFIFISTDKAVRPTNLMGATKRFCELILQAQSDRPDNKTKFTMVRFGNVLNSAGSVLPLFRKQIRNGGPVTVTDRNVIRYFMSIPEAVQLVIQAGAMSKGGDVFLLDMGKPVSILKMAKKMIHLSGLTYSEHPNKDGDIIIEFTGLRPGEKLYEELLISDEPKSTQHERIMVANEDKFDFSQIKKTVDELHALCKKQDAASIKKILKKYVVGYNYKKNKDI